MRIIVSNWLIENIPFEISPSEIIERFGQPQSISNYKEGQQGYFYGPVNYNFDDNKLSAVGFGTGADLIIDGINPFENPSDFLSLVQFFSMQDHFGLKIIPVIGLQYEGFEKDEIGIPKAICLMSKFAVSKYL